MKKARILWLLAILSLTGCGGASSSAPPPTEEEMIQQSQKDQQDAAKGKRMPGN